MYMDDNTLNVSDKISDSVLRRMLGDECVSCPSLNIVSERESADIGPSCHKGETWGLRGNYPLAMVYAPIQEFEDTYDLDTALSRGTIFKKLDLPFMGQSVTRGGNCRG